MPLSPEQLEHLRSKYSGNAADMHDPRFQKVAQTIFSEGGTRAAPYSGIPTLLSAPAFAVDPKAPDFGNLQVGGCDPTQGQAWDGASQELSLIHI